MNFNLRSRVLTEFLGTAFLLASVIGSGIMGEQLAGGNVAIALLANTLATGAMLTVLILALGPISGAHFNPVVTLAMAWAGNLPRREVPAYLAAQFAGAFAGVAAAHLMFGMRLFFASTHARRGAAQLWSEAVATFGLLLVIWGCSAFGLPQPRTPWEPTSALPIGSRHRPHSRIRRSHSPGPPATPSRGFVRWMYCLSWQPNWWEDSRQRCCFHRLLRGR